MAFPLHRHPVGVPAIAVFQGSDVNFNPERGTILAIVPHDLTHRLPVAQSLMKGAQSGRIGLRSMEDSGATPQHLLQPIAGLPQAAGLA